MPSYKPLPKQFAEGRLAKPMSELLRSYNEGPRLAWEVKHLSAIVRVDRAHVVMLARQGYMTRAHAGALLAELDDIGAAGPAAFAVAPGYGSMVLQMERVLAERLGDDVAGRLPVARSRLDQGAAVRRLADRDGLLRVVGGLLALDDALVAAAARHARTPFLGYTHLQQAQPATYGHYLLAFSDRLHDSFQQLAQAYRRVDRCPLGAVGLAGTTLAIDRHLTARLLGFSDVLDNARLGRDAYYQAELVFALTMAMTLLNDLCTDLHLYSSVEFATVELDDALCSTSSVFPHKKNPYALETVKTKAAEAQGWVVSALAVFRNEGTGDTNGRNVAFIDDACDTTAAMMRLTAEIVRGVTVREARCEELLSRAWVTTNRLGNVLLTDHHLDYRSAHSVVGRLVKNCLDNGVAKPNVTVEMLHEAVAEMGMEPIDMTQEDLVAALSHTEFINNSISHGSIGPEQVERLLVKATRRHYKSLAWVDETTRRLKVADSELDAAAKQFCQSASP
ncbi:argininosuccinate lyase [Cordyceps javanica]|uniref:Arginosuccinase n=1 Tax=Cordyceps javanica TaxID=43265 RepID=A0A545VW46_9HYPO|nr:argininosuccinate lyase [Cordyceps javanica]TQW05941.1 argininosuccinate lyase [Cordyceps javanica]